MITVGMKWKRLRRLGGTAGADESAPDGDFDTQASGGQSAEEGRYPALAGLGSPGEGVPRSDSSAAAR